MTSATPRHIRRATPADADALAALRYEFRAGHRQATEDADGFQSRCAAWMRARLADDERWRAWVLDIDGALAGAVWLEFVEKLPNPNGEPELHAYVTSFYVNPMHRNVGAGSRLLAALLDDCRSARVDAVFLWPSERSRPLYERNGFIAASNMFVREL